MKQLANVTDEQWQAIVHNNSNYDGLFWYGVHSTKIVCRPSCRSRVPRKDGVTIFKQMKAAYDEGYRACKRCKPEGKAIPQKEWIEDVKLWIDEHLHEPIQLERLAQKHHSSPYHLQRVFKSLVGMSPNEYIQQKRIEASCQLLRTTSLSIAIIGQQVGYTHTTYYNALFKKIMGISPLQYRKSYIEDKKERGEL